MTHFERALLYLLYAAFMIESASTASELDLQIGLILVISMIGGGFVCFAIAVNEFIKSFGE